MDVAHITAYLADLCRERQRMREAPDSLEIAAGAVLDFDRVGATHTFRLVIETDGDVEAFEASIYRPSRNPYASGEAETIVRVCEAHDILGRLRTLEDDVQTRRRRIVDDLIARGGRTPF